MKYFALSIIMILFFVACGESTESGKNFKNDSSRSSDDTKYTHSYKGLKFYTKNLEFNQYALPQVDDATFDALSVENKLLVADKLLSTLFFAYPTGELKSRITSTTFISDLQTQLKEKKNSKNEIETTIKDRDLFFHSEYSNDEVNNILARFYVMKDLDAFYINNWISYILTQTIMFSPAYELTSSHHPNTERVYNALVRNLQDGTTISYGTYLHVIGSDNWRRFRSPEDNGREMLEIYTLVFDDAKVPVAGKALQNWKLDRDSDTLVVGLNENEKPLSLFGSTIYNGYDFYRELVKSSAFKKGVITRVVDFFFTNSKAQTKKYISDTILASNPNSWRDILLQIVFSKAYLLESAHVKSAEETFFSLAKKMDYKHYNYTFVNFATALEEMHQATMKYKLGKLQRVPLDTLSFINYHKFIRESIMISRAHEDKLQNYTEYGSHGWKPGFIEESHFNLSADDAKASLYAFVHYLFESTILRKARPAELQLFQKHILKNDRQYNSGLSLLKDDERANVATLVLDYISRLDELYRYKKVD